MLGFADLEYKNIIEERSTRQESSGSFRHRYLNWPSMNFIFENGSSQPKPDFDQDRPI